MKRFEFRLERVLDWRREQADVEEARLQPLFAERRHIQAERAQLETERAAADSAVVALREHSSTDLAALDAYRRHVRAAREKLDRREGDCGARILEQRRQVLVARRRFHLLERLKERARKHWQSDFDRELETLASEAFLARWRRR